MSDEEAKNYELCCGYCLAYLNRSPHCDDRPGTFRGCHETFSDTLLLAEHIHPQTGGCRWPGNIEDYYRKDNIWHKKEPKPPEEDTQEASRNSSPTRGAGKRTTWRDSDARTSREDQRLGQSSA